MISDTEARDLAEAYLAALVGREDHRSLAGTASGTSLEDAYRVQDAFRDARRLHGAGDIAGYKVALTSAAMQEFVGVDHPLAGAVHTSGVLTSPARVRLANHIHLGVECEVAIRLGHDLGPGTGPYDRESIAEAVSSCHAAFELIEDRNADYGAINVFDLVAENAWNAAVVLGPEVTAWRDADLVGAVTRLRANGDVVGEGRTGDALGHPLDATAWLVNHVTGRGGTVTAGQFVMTGSSVVTQFPDVGDHYEFTIDGLGQVSLRCD